MIPEKIKKEMKKEALDKYKSISRCGDCAKLEDGFCEWYGMVVFYFNIKGGTTKTIIREV